MKRIATLSLIAMMISVGGISQERALPGKFKEADTDQDGIISIPEVREMIDGFFIGKHDHGVMYIHDLIDYFFEQKS